MAWPLNGIEAGCNLVLMKTSLFSLNQVAAQSGADLGFFLGWGTPLNDVTDGEVKKIKKRIPVYEEESFISGGGGCAPLQPPPRSAPVNVA